MQSRAGNPSCVWHRIRPSAHRRGRRASTSAGDKSAWRGQRVKAVAYVLPSLRGKLGCQFRILDNQTQQAQHCTRRCKAALLPISPSGNWRTDALSKCGLSQAGCLARLPHDICSGLVTRPTCALASSGVWRRSGIGLDGLGDFLDVHHATFWMSLGSKFSRSASDQTRSAYFWKIGVSITAVGSLAMQPKRADAPPQPFG